MAFLRIEDVKDVVKDALKERDDKELRELRASVAVKDKFIADLKATIDGLRAELRSARDAVELVEKWKTVMVVGQTPAQPKVVQPAKAAA